jgi:Ca2+-binding EF-hand superfamily protein
MKYLLAAIVAGMWIASTDVRADEGGGKAEAKKKLLEKYDANGDGQLDNSERAAARQDMAKKKRGKKGPGAAGPGVGGISREEREMLTQRFDADGDGKLNDEERAAMQAELAKRPRGPAQPDDGNGRRPPQIPPQVLQILRLFDRDGNGQLDDAERAALMDELQRRGIELPPGSRELFGPGGLSVPTDLGQGENGQRPGVGPNEGRPRRPPGKAPRQKGKK